MTYRYYSQTSSGWLIEMDLDADPDKRWRATHPKFGERFFDRHDKILRYTLKHMANHFTQAMKDPVTRAQILAKIKKLKP